MSRAPWPLMLPAIDRRREAPAEHGVTTAGVLEQRDDHGAPEREEYVADRVGDARALPTRNPDATGETEEDLKADAK